MTSVQKFKVAKWRGRHRPKMGFEDRFGFFCASPRGGVVTVLGKEDYSKSQILYFSKLVKVLGLSPFEMQVGASQSPIQFSQVRFSLGFRERPVQAARRPLQRRGRHRPRKVRNITSVRMGCHIHFAGQSPDSKFGSFWRGRHRWRKVEITQV